MTLRETVNLIILIATFIGSIGTIAAVITKLFEKRVKKILEPMQIQIHKMDVKECRRFLIDFLVDIEKGCEKNEVQWKFAHDVYDHYTDDLKENSYVKDFWERVVINGNNE